MRRLLGVVAVLILVSPSAVIAQWFDYARQAQAGYPPYGFRVFTDWRPATLRLDVSPADAQVFVDARYLGSVDNFKSAFHRLTLSGGPHLVIIRKPGFTSLALEIAVFPGQSVTFSRKMQPAADPTNPDIDELAPAFEEGAALPPTTKASGDVRLDVKPKDADVYADGFYVGTVEDFSGSQHLMLTLGQHHLSMQHDGYEPLDVTMTVDSERTVIYRAALTKPAGH
jgi:hypothetical protein